MIDGVESSQNLMILSIIEGSDDDTKAVDLFVIFHFVSFG